MKNGCSLDRSSRIRCRIDQRCGTGQARRSAARNASRAELFSWGGSSTTRSVNLTCSCRRGFVNPNPKQPGGPRKVPGEGGQGDPCTSPGVSSCLLSPLLQHCRASFSPGGRQGSWRSTATPGDISQCALAARSELLAGVCSCRSHKFVFSWLGSVLSGKRLRLPRCAVAESSLL